MKTFLWNLLLALLWTSLSGDITLYDLTVGFALGFLVLLLAKRTMGQVNYFRKVVNAFELFLFFIRELTISSLKLAFDILTPRHRMKPGIVAVPLEVRTDLEIILLANLISLTPGTLSLDISRNRKFLFVHAMYLPEEGVETFRENIKKKYETRILELTR